MSERRRPGGSRRRVVAALGHLVFWPLLTVAALLISTLLHLHMEAGRRVVASQVSALATELIRGELVIGRIATLGPGEVTLENVEVRDPAGELVLAVGSVTVRPDPFSLWGDELRIHSLAVDEPRVWLTERDGELALKTALSPVDPAPATAETSPVRLVIESLTVSGGAARGLPDGYAVEEIQLDASLQLDPDPRIGIRHLTARALRDGEQLASLARLEGTVHLAPGRSSALELELRSGEDRLEATGELLWTADGPGRFSADLDADVTPALLTRFGLTDGAAVLVTPVGIQAHAEGTVASLDVDARLESAGGRVQLTAQRRGEQATLEIDTDGVDLVRVVGGVEGVVAGRLRLELAGLSSDEREVVATVEDGRYGEWSAPMLRARATVGPEAVVLHGLDAPHLIRGGGHLELTGRVGFDRSIELDLDAHLPQLAVDENVRRVAPGVRGAVTARLSARASPGAESIDVEGRLEAQALRMPGLRARDLRVEGEVHGAPDAPIVRLAARGSGLSASGTTITSLSARINGGPTRYRGDVDVRLAGGRRFVVAATASREGRLIRGEGRIDADGLLPGRVSAVVPELLVDLDRAVSGSVDVEGNGVGASASGRYAFAGASSLTGDLRRLDLEKLGELLGVEGLAGEVRGEVRFSGTPRQPSLTAALHLRDGRAREVPIAALDVVLDVSAPERRLTAELSGEVADQAHVSGTVLAELPEGRVFITQLEGARYSVRLDVDSTPAGLLQLVSPDAPAIAGVIGLHLRGEGTREDPVLAVDIEATGLATSGIQPVDARARVDVDSTTARAAVWARDAVGPLVSATVGVDVPEAIRRGDAGPSALREAPWIARISIPSRRLDRLPFPGRPDIPAHASVEATVRGGAGPLAADARIQVGHWLDRSDFGEGCRPGTGARLIADVRLRDGVTRVTARGEVDGRSVLSVTGRAPTPVDDWMAGPRPTRPPAIGLRGHIEGLDLAQVPTVCEHASGVVQADFRADGLLGPAPHVTGELLVGELRVGMSPEVVDVRVAGALDPESLRIEADMREGTRDALLLRARLPLELPADASVPRLADAPWHARLVLDHAPVAPLLGPVTSIVQPRGRMHGGLNLEGRGASVTAEGAVELEEIGFTLRRPVTRVTGLRGRIAIRDDAIVLEGLRLRDRGGELRASGRIGLEALRPGDLSLRIAARDYPLRNEGVVTAIVDGDITIDGHLGADTHRIDVTVRRASMELTDRSGQQVQPLDQHVDVIYEDQPGFVADAGPGRAGSGETVIAPADARVPLVVNVDASERFWVRRDDLAIQLSARLRYETDERGPRLSGPVEIHRGFMLLLGRSFDIQRGSLVFSGGTTADPIIDLTAIHTLDSDETVTAIITGPVRHPEIRFATDVPGVESEAEILQLLVYGRGGTRQDAEGEATSALGALTAGLVTSLTRREVGRLLPRFSIESRGTRGTRVRAGVQADDLIPAFLRGVVRSAYVEGFLGSAEDNNSAASTTGGLLLELYFAHDLVTTGAFEQPDNWSVDLTWEP